MFPLINFFGGIALGVVGVKIGRKNLSGSVDRAGSALRGAATRSGNGLRNATVSGLTAIEKSASGLRQRIRTVPEGGADAAESTEDSVVEETALRAKSKTPRKRINPRKVPAIKQTENN